jgi:hypothetical protein
VAATLARGRDSTLTSNGDKMRAADFDPSDERDRPGRFPV